MYTLNKKRGDNSNMFWNVLLLIVLGLFTMIIFNLLYIFLLDKLRINKWIVLVLGILLIGLSTYLMGTNLHMLVKILCIIISVMPFMWFYNILNKEKYEKKNNTKIKIKPKAKPNRVKNSKK